MKWKGIPGWKKFYQCHPNGKIRSIDRTIYIKNPQGIFAFRKFKGRILIPGVSVLGYPTVWLSCPKKLKSYSLHTLMLLTFIGKPPKNMETLHKNGIKTDCRLSNLRYGTRSENAQDKYRHGYIHPSGFSNKNSKLIKKDYVYIKKNLNKFSSREMGKKFKVSHGTILNAIKNIRGIHD